MSSTYEQVKQRKLLFREPTTVNTILGAFEGGDEWLSRNQIAGRCFRSVTPSFIELLESAVQKKWLVKSTEPLANGYKKFWYKLGAEKLL